MPKRGIPPTLTPAEEPAVWIDRALVIVILAAAVWLVSRLL